MKTITFEGQEYDARDWVRYVARDRNGVVWGHECIPEAYTSGWYSNGMSCELIRSSNYDWTQSMVGVLEDLK